MTQTGAIWLPRVLGVVAAGIAGKLAEKGITVDPAIITTGMLGVYAFVHRLVSKHVNPGDAAKAAIVTDDKAIVSDSSVGK